MSVLQSVTHPGLSHRVNLRRATTAVIMMSLFVLALTGPAMAQTLPTNLVSRGLNGETANGDSRLGAVSGAGFDAVFTSTATNLIADEQGDPAFSRIYLHRETALLRLRPISRGLGGMANGSSRTPTLSRDAQHVVFASDASNLIANDNNPFTDIFAVFADTAATEPPDPALTRRLSTNEFGDAPDGSSRNPVISGNGRHVLFESRANNLDLGSGISRSAYDLFVVDRDSDSNGTFDEPGTLRPVRLVQFETGLASPAAFRGYDISENGRYVVFSTAFLGVTADPVTASYNLYFHDRDSDVDGIYDEPGAVTTTLLGRDAPNGIALSMDADYPEIDADALRVTFHSNAAEIQTVCSAGTDCSIFIADIPANGPDIRLPESATLLRGLAGTPGQNARLNPNGTLLTYTSDSSPQALRLHNIQAATDTPLCLSQTLRRGNRGCGIALAGNGSQFITLDAASSNLVPLDVNARSDVFIRNTFATPPPNPASTACDDQIDNDGNNLIDLEDPGCFAPEDNDEALTDIVKLVPVTPAAELRGAYTVIDQQGRPGKAPDFAISSNGLRRAAYSAEVRPGDRVPFDELRTAQFDPVSGRTTVRDEGSLPRIATDPNNRLHIAYVSDRDLAYLVEDGTSPQLQPTANGCNFEYRHSLVLNSTDTALIPNWDSCSSDLRLWQPGSPPAVIAASLPAEIELLEAAISANDDLLLAYVDVDTSDFSTLQLMRLDSAGTLLTQQTILLPEEPIGLDLRSDALGIGHVAYTSRKFFSSGSGGADVPDLLYFREQGGSWVQEALYLPEGDLRHRVQLRFASDGTTPIFVLSGTLREGPVRQFTFDNGQFSELASLEVPGMIEQFALDQRTDGSFEFLYRSMDEGNVIHADPTAPVWMTDTVTTAAFTDLRDLSLRNLFTPYPNDPVLLTFHAPSSGAAGELVYHQRNVDTAQWESEVIGAAFPQDAVDLSDSGEMLVQVLNSEGRMIYAERSPAGDWDVDSTVVTLSGFDAIDNVHVTGNPTGPIVVYGILRSGDGQSGDVLVAYTRDSPTDPWQQTPFAGNPVTMITEAQARRSYVAYVDGQQNDLHLARFDRGNRQWSSELVDTDVAPINIGKTVSLQLTQWIRSAGGILGDVPTIAYRTDTRDRIRYAMKTNAWRIWEYEETLPPGISIDGIDHLLINDSRLRPLIAARFSDGRVMAYRRAGGAAADDADAVAIERTPIAADGVNAGGLGLIRLAQSAASNVAYSSAGTSTRLAISRRATGLPAANPAHSPTRLPDARSRAFGDLASTMCICFIRNFFGSMDTDDGCGTQARVDLGTRAISGADPDLPPSDEAVLGQWGTLFERTLAGQRYIEFYARDYPKISRLAAQDPGLLIDGVNTLQNFMPGIRAMVEGNGDQVFLTQQMIDDGLDIWQRLADRDDGTLSAFIQTELALWNDMQDFVGLSFDEWGTLIGLEVGAVVGDALFADSFED